mmetsp:Transcript_55254/g.103594  ORF Transcript_55254/g.103594 Transcript_55254/m.103594 type:complete len:412 (-) Transcript_55254:192-1427(-)
MMPADEEENGGDWSPDAAQGQDLDGMLRGMDVPEERAEDEGAQNELSSPLRALGGDEDEMIEDPMEASKAFDIALQKHPGMRLGMECVGIGQEVVVQSILEGLVVSQWNAKNPDRAVHVGDVVLRVNQICPDDPELMLGELRNAVVLNLRFERGPRDLSKAKDVGDYKPLMQPSGGDMIRLAQRKLMEEQTVERAHAIQEVTRTEGYGEIPVKTWQAAAEWSLDGKCCEETAYLTVYGYRAVSKTTWNEEFLMPDIRLDVEEHMEQAGNTWYVIKCGLNFTPLGEQLWTSCTDGGVGALPAESLQWQAPRRLQQLRGDLHDRLKYFMEEDFYAKVFEQTPFARHGGLPGTTARLQAWLARLAKAINSKEVPPQAVAITLLFLHAPLPSHVESPPASVEAKPKRPSQLCFSI